MVDAYFFYLKSIMKSVCVYLGANFGYAIKLVNVAEELGKELANRGLRLIYGGSSLGLMGKLAQSTIIHGGEVTGIIPQCLIEKEKPLTNLTKLIITETMQQRKLLMQEHADIFIVMPGGLGTLEEAIETWNAAKIGMVNKVIGFLNLDGYFDILFAFMRHCEQQGFLSPSQRRIPLVESDIKILLNTLLKSSENEAPTMAV